MRLTNTIRNAIVTSVMASTDFPELKQSIRQRTSDLARELIAARVPEKFNHMLSTYGEEEDWFAQINSVNLSDSLSPTYVIANHCWNLAVVEFEPVFCPIHFNHSFTKEEQEQYFGALRFEAEHLMKLIERTEGELRAFLASCTTTEKLLARMPEIEPHTPKTAISYPIVASTATLTSYLLKAGFDTNVKKVV